MFSPVSAAVINAVSKEDSATASSYYSLFMQIGGSIGISVLAVLHQSLQSSYQHQGKTAEASSHYSLEIAFLVSAIITILAVWPALKLSKQLSEPSQE